MREVIFNQISKHFTNFLSAEAAEIVKDICLAVKFLHDMNVAHRDLLYTTTGLNLFLIH